MKPLRRLPPLNALRSYEAAARHLSFTKAAGELGVTPAAVSHQVKMLEDHIGIALFQRVNRQLVLTEAGGACVPGIRMAFEGLAGAIDCISVAGRSGVLTVSVPPSLAGKWLLPRLDRFKSVHPDIDVRVSASVQLVDFASGKIDVAIRYGTGRYPGLKSERLIDEAVIPVCSPRLLEGPHPLRSPADVGFHTLLHDDSPDEDTSCPTWDMWLKAAGVEGVDATRGPRFNQPSLVLEAAILGQGIALAKSTIAAADLAEGRVVKPFELTLPLAFGYYIVYPESKTLMPKVDLLVRWLKEEAASTTPSRVSAVLRPIATDRPRRFSNGVKPTAEGPSPAVRRVTPAVVPDPRILPIKQEKLRTTPRIYRASAE
ncbi:MAG: transcriptional regulator GcvA [Rhodospirillales bacterium]|nr:transcriptional regulator GcvA [Rhodospirillales bacterium]